MARPYDNQRRLAPGRALVQGVRRFAVMWRHAGGVLGAAVVVGAVQSMQPLSDVAGGLLALASVVLVWMAWGAVVRLGVAEDVQGAKVLGLGRGGFQFRRLEWRMAAGLLLIMLFLTMIGSVLGLLALALAGGAELNAEAIKTGDWAMVGPAWKLWLLAGVGAVVLWVPLAMFARLCLFAQASAGRGYLVSLNAMKLTRGAFWPLLLIVLVLLGLKLTIWILTIGAWPGSQVLQAVLLIGGVLPLAAGVLGDAYRQLEYWRPGQGVD